VYEYAVDGESPVSEYVVVVVLSTATPSLEISYPATPTLSIAAVHVRSIRDDDTAAASIPIGTEGASVSGSSKVVAAALADGALAFPAAS
jgi:hypothetical protein